MEEVSITADKLGIDVDYRIALKDFSDLYLVYDSLDIDVLLNPNLNHLFWSKTVGSWINKESVDEFILAFNEGKLHLFEESISIDWLNIKRKDYNYLWRLHSFEFLNGLVGAYDHTNNSTFLDRAFLIIDSWKHDFIDSYHPNEIFPWNDHTTANRVLALVYFFYYLREREYKNNKLMNELKNIILIHIYILSCRNFYSFHTNHGMFQANNTYVACTLFSKKLFNIDFQKINLDRLREEFDFSFTRSCVHKENSPEYHYVIFKNILYFDSSLKQLENDPKELILNVDKFIENSLKFLAYAIKPNGFLPTIGDTEEKKLDDLSYLSNYNNYDHYQYAISCGERGKVLPKIACAFENAGYFFIKSCYEGVGSKDQFYLASKSGFLSKYHRQNDDCSFVLSAYGEDWFVDGGLYKHEHHDVDREYMRSHYSHNLLSPKKVIIERENPPLDIVEYKWGIRDWMVTSNLVNASLATQMYDSYDYRREFIYYAPYQLKIKDSLFPIEDNCGEYYLVFHLPNNKKISVLNSSLGFQAEIDNKFMNLAIEINDDVLESKVLVKDDLPPEFIQKISKNYNILEECHTVLFYLKVKKDIVKLDVAIDISFKKKLDSPKKVFILGSCVSRDAFEYPEAGQFEIVKYLARTSLASSFHDVLTDDINTSHIASTFQRRMVENDLWKTTEKELLQTHFDYLILDLIDERFQLFKDEKGGVFTVSSELKDNISFQNKGIYLDPNGDDFFELWCKGWDKLILLAKDNSFIDKIVVNKVYWTNVTDDGTLLYPNYSAWIDRNNNWLERLYSYIEKVGGVRMLDYPREVFIADANHKWGAQPYHYSAGFYLKFLESLVV